MSALKTLCTFRPRAAMRSPLRARSWVCALMLILGVSATAAAQGGPETRPRRLSSRLKSPAETVATPPATSAPEAVTSPQPVYEFETGNGGELIAPAEVGGEYYEEGPYFAEDFGDGLIETGGYRRYGCPGICIYPFCCEQLYFRADYLLWWGKGFYSPPLVTTSTPGTSSADAGVLGLPSTSTLFPTGNLADAAQSGGRARIGYWFDPFDTVAVEGTYFAIGQATSTFSASDADYPILARPFVNVTTGSVGNDAQLIAYPNLYTGTIAVTGTSSLQGVEVLVRHAISRGCNWRVDWTLGWRYNRLDDSLNISSDRATLGSPTAPLTGATLTGWDRFSTRNTFNGVQLGVITEYRCCRWWFETRTSLALGNNRAQVLIDGQSTSYTPGGEGGGTTVTSSGGLLAQPSNIGSYVNDDFSVVPQVGVNLGFEIVGGLWATVGYNFMYWSRVARPGEQIDSDVNLSQSGGGNLIGLARPSYPGLTTDYWAQGLNFGLAYRF